MERGLLTMAVFAKKLLSVYAELWPLSRFFWGMFYFMSMLWGAQASSTTRGHCYMDRMGRNSIRILSFTLTVICTCWLRLVSSAWKWLSDFRHKTHIENHKGQVPFIKCAVSDCVPLQDWNVWPFSITVRGHKTRQSNISCVIEGFYSLNFYPVITQRLKLALHT